MNSLSHLINVKVVQGPDAGSTFGLDCPSLTVGRGTDCDVVLTDPTVSRVHLRIFKGDGGWSIEHMGGLNGTHVNGRALRVGEPPFPIRSGARISTGSSVIVVDFRHIGLADAYGVDGSCAVSTCGDVGGDGTGFGVDGGCADRGGADGRGADGRGADDCPPPDLSIKLGAPPSLRPPEVDDAQPTAPSPLKRLAAPIAIVALAILFIAAVFVRSCL